MIENADNGMTSDAIDEVLTGATFVAGGKASIATTAYEYLVTVDDDLNGLKLEVTGASGYNSLNNMNMDVDDATIRGFNFSFFKGPDTYNIDESLGMMADGDFTVTGYSDDASESKVSGYLRERLPDDEDGKPVWSDPTTNQGAMFIIKDYGVDFTLLNLTIEYAKREGLGGAAIHMDNAPIE